MKALRDDQQGTKERRKKSVHSEFGGVLIFDRDAVAVALAIAIPVADAAVPAAALLADFVAVALRKADRFEEMEKRLDALCCC